MALTLLSHAPPHIQGGALDFPRAFSGLLPGPLYSGVLEPPLSPSVISSSLVASGITSVTNKSPVYISLPWMALRLQTHMSYSPLTISVCVSSRHFMPHLPQTEFRVLLPKTSPTFIIFASSSVDGISIFQFTQPKNLNLCLLSFTSTTPGSPVGFKLHPGGDCALHFLYHQAVLSRHHVLLGLLTARAS